MIGKKAFIKIVVLSALVVLLIAILLGWQGKLFSALTTAFNFLINMISVSYGKTPDIEAGTLTPPPELNQAYNSLVSFLKDAKYNNECLIYNLQFPQDFQSYSIVLDKSRQKAYNGLFIIIQAPKGEEVKREFIEQKYPCVVTGQSQVRYFINKFILKQSDTTQQKYARANKITVKGKNTIIVEYESGQKLTNGVLDDSNLMFNIDQNNICFVPTYRGLLGASYDRGIPPQYVRNLDLQKQYQCA